MALSCRTASGEPKRCFSPSRRGARPATLYGTIVAQPRLASFYSDFAVADTGPICDVERDRRGVGPEATRLLQGPFAWFCWALDDNLRKMGISDFKNVEEMRGIGKTLYNCSEP